MPHRYLPTKKKVLTSGFVQSMSVLQAPGNAATLVIINSGVYGYFCLWLLVVTCDNGACVKLGRLDVLTGLAIGFHSNASQMGRYADAANHNRTISYDCCASFFAIAEFGVIDVSLCTEACAGLGGIPLLDGAVREIVEFNR
jgi:hypothetical protein